MFKFEKEQKVWDFNGTKLGGQPGEYPTVLQPQSSTTNMRLCWTTRQERLTSRWLRHSGTAVRHSLTQPVFRI